MKKITLIAAAGLMLGASSMVSAEMGVGAKAGTLGYGAEFTYGISESFNARVGLNSYSYSDTATQDDIDYDMDMDWRTTGAFMDWHPFKGSFRLTLGYILNNNEISMSAEPSGTTVDIGDQAYPTSAVGKLKGAVDFGNGVFYGVGWGNAGDGKGLGFILELGVLQQSPDLTLKTEGTDPLLESNATFQEDLKREEKNAQDDLDEFDQYPVISLGLSYSF